MFTHKKLLLCRTAVSVLLLMMCLPAFAQATRTWVSGVGDDANPCSRTAPCKTFAGAISKTADGGEIDALDPGGYGAVTITKSITISGVGTNASILVSGTNGVVINAGADDVVILRNINLQGIGTGLSGISFLAGAALHVEHVEISNFRGVSNPLGIRMAPSSGLSRLFVRDATISENGNGAAGGGIYIAPTAGAYVIAEISDSRVTRNMGFGVRADDNSFVTIKNSEVSGNYNNGVLALSNSTVSEIVIDGNVIADNGWNPGTVGAALLSQGGSAIMRISNNMVYGNENGLRTALGGNIFSFGTNRVTGNSTNGSPTGSLSSM